MLAFSSSMQDGKKWSATEPPKTQTPVPETAWPSRTPVVLWFTPVQIRLILEV